MKKILVFLSIVFAFNIAGAQSIDLKILDKVNGPYSQTADERWKTYSDLNTPVCIITPVTIFIIGQINKDKTVINKSYQLASSIVAAELLTEGMKEIFKRDRPFRTYPDQIYQKAKGKGYSFPSGHTSSAFALATSLTLNFPKWYVIVPSYAYASTIAYSRMYLGVHYPSDVFGGMIIGAGSAYLSYKINAILQKKK